MKRIILALAVLLGVQTLQAQDIEDVKKFIVLNRFDEAKPEIDKFLSNEKNAAKPTGWYYKAYIYSNLARQNGKSAADSKALNQEAFDAIKKYMQLDPKTTLTNEENNGTVFSLYNNYYSLGVKMYQDKDYESSCDFFKKTLEVHDYIYSKNLAAQNGFKFSAHDTDVVWNLAFLSAELSKRDTTKLPDLYNYYHKIADADLGDEKYVDVYDELVKKYRKEDNKEMFAKYIAQAKKHYGSDPYWETIEIQYAVKGLEGETLFKKYEELLTTHPDNYMVNFNYGYELEKYIYSAEAKGKDISGYKKKIPELFKKAIALNSTITANFLLANHYYNSSFDIMDEANKIKSTKPEDIMKKNELLASRKSTILESEPYALKAAELFSQLKEYNESDKENYKQILGLLSTVAKQKGDLKKAEEYNSKKAEVDKL